MINIAKHLLYHRLFHKLYTKNRI